MTSVQARIARALGIAHGHGWASLPTVVGLLDPEEIRDAYRFSSYDWPGIAGPDEVDGVVGHTTGSNRTSWSITAEGTVVVTRRQAVAVSPEVSPTQAWYLSPEQAGEAATIVRYLSRSLETGRTEERGYEPSDADIARLDEIEQCVRDAWAAPEEHRLTPWQIADHQRCMRGELRWRRCIALANRATSVHLPCRTPEQRDALRAVLARIWSRRSMLRRWQP